MQSCNYRNKQYTIKRIKNLGMRISCGSSRTWAGGTEIYTPQLNVFPTESDIFFDRYTLLHNNDEDIYMIPNIRQYPEMFPFRKEVSDELKRLIEKDTYNMKKYKYTEISDVYFHRVHSSMYKKNHHSYFDHIFNAVFYVIAGKKFQYTVDTEGYGAQVYMTKDLAEYIMGVKKKYPDLGGEIFYIADQYLWNMNANNIHTTEDPEEVYESLNESGTMMYTGGHMELSVKKTGDKYEIIDYPAGCKLTFEKSDIIIGEDLRYTVPVDYDAVFTDEFKDFLHQFIAYILQK